MPNMANRRAPAALATPSRTLSDSKGYSSPGADSSASTTLGDYSQLTSGRVSSMDAKLMCCNALAHVEVDSAIIRVDTCSRGCVSGRLDLAGTEPQDVTVALLPIKRGYTVLSDVIEGPEVLQKVCWKLKSVNGIGNAEDLNFVRNDVLVFEGPRWATDRVYARASTTRPLVDCGGHDAKEDIGQAGVQAAPSIAVTRETNKLLGIDPGLASLVSESRFELDVRHRGQPSKEGASLSSDEKSTDASRSVASAGTQPDRQLPAVPPLDFARIQSRNRGLGCVPLLCDHVPSQLASGRRCRTISENGCQTAFDDCVSM
mmetsp:Transcript_88713/g.249864  ORF Transcript_88713/g.249864 Transcript_88713/m.249864 type:complete len:316 (-) Transcript_88713:110-1057(-)